MVSLDVPACGYAFTRNPIFLNIQESGVTRYVVKVGDDRYSGTVEGCARLNIAEVVEAMLPDLNVSDPGNEVFCLVTPISAFNVEVDVLPEALSESDGASHFSFIALKGGVSNQNFKVLDAAGTDVFESRFLNFTRNFFLTAHSDSWLLSMKETELYPLCFLSDVGLSITVRELVSGNEFTWAAPAKSVCALNVAGLRYRLFSENGVLANAFEIFADGKPACRLSIEQAKAAKERYNLIFRNSFGVKERVDIAATGSVKYGNADGDSDNSSLLRYDMDIDEFVRINSRRRAETTITIKSMLKSASDIRILKDLLASDEVSLLSDVYGEIPVIVKAEDFGHAVRVETPESYSLKLTVCCDEANVSELIASPAHYGKPKIFSQTFSKQFC